MALRAEAAMADVAPSGDPMVPGLARVLRRHRETADTWTLELESDDPALLRFAPGQFNMLYAYGIGEVAISVSGSPLGARHLVHTIRAVGPVSEALAGLPRGAMLGVRGPYGEGWPLDQAAGHDVIVVAGGLGLAPLRPVLYPLFAERQRYGRIVLLCGARSPDDIPFQSELMDWRRRLDVQVEVTVDHASDHWHGHVGFVTRLIPKATFDPDQTVAFVCGPEVMMRVAIKALVDETVAPEAIWLSMERHMRCALGHCGRCQFGPVFVCREGPVFRYDRVASLLAITEL
jgi:NAD(P)H-flavin reductase